MAEYVLDHHLEGERKRRCLGAAGVRISARRPALLVLCTLLGQRALSVFRAMLTDHCSQALSRDRRSPVQRPNVALKERDQSQRRGRDDRGCAQAAFRHLRRRERVRRGGKHGDFAYDITGPDRSHRRAPDDDIGGAALDGEQRMPDMPLAGESLPRSDFDLGRHTGDGGKLVFRQVGEERNRRNPGAIHLVNLHH
jgi:hypothetical protein